MKLPIILPKYHIFFFIHKLIKMANNIFDFNLAFSDEIALYFFFFINAIDAFIVVNEKIKF